MRAGGPKLDSLDNVQYGLHYGIVCQNKDPDNLDRVKIRLPWLDHGDVDQTHWAQLMTPMEGKKFGWYTLPDIDDVVVVMFIGGDTSQPVVLGGVWSKPDFSPETNEDGKNHFRGYRSRTGHRLIFDDSAKPKVVFADKTTKNVLAVGALAGDGTGPNKTEVWKPAGAGDAGVAVASMEGALQVACPDGTLTVEAGKNILMTAGKSVAIKTGDALTADAKTVKISSGSPANYQGSTVDIA